MTPISIAAYLLLFAAVGCLFLLVTLLLGRLLRAVAPTPEKLQPYECGEPPVGSAYVQFDLRFYVVALVFLIFDVEIAFFFPWATVFGKVVRLMHADLPAAVATATYPQLGLPHLEAGADAQAAAQPAPAAVAADAGRLALAAMADIGVFFGLLLVGFAYVWKQGDLDWVRAVGERD